MTTIKQRNLNIKMQLLASSSIMNADRLLWSISRLYTSRPLYQRANLCPEKDHADTSNDVHKLLPRGAVIRWSPKSSYSNEISARHDWRGGRNVVQEEHECGMVTSVTDSLLKAVQSQGESGTGKMCVYFIHSHQDPAFVSSRGDTHQVSLPPVSSLGKRYTAVLKACETDWQVNELDIFGEAVFITSRPRSRWRKVAQADTIMIEDNSNESFADPSKTYTPRRMNAGKYVPIKGKVPYNSQVLCFNVYRERFDMEYVVNRLRYTTKVNHDAIGFAGHADFSGAAPFLDHFGCITHQGRALNLSKELITQASKHYNIHPLVFQPVQYTPFTAPFRSEVKDHSSRNSPSFFSTTEKCSFHVDTSGTYYRIALRCTSISSDHDLRELIDSLTQFGFLNYYPISKFSLCSVRKHELAAAVGTSEYYRACAGYLQCKAEGNPVFCDKYLQYVNTIFPKDNPSSTFMKETVKLMTDHAINHRMSPKFVQFLTELQSITDFSSSSLQLKHLWNSCVSTNEKLQYYHAAAAFLWNAMASQRVISGGCMTAAVGDVVYISERQYLSLEINSNRGDKGSARKARKWKKAVIEGRYHPSDELCYVTVIESREEAAQYGIDQVVLPVCDHRRLLVKQHKNATEEESEASEMIFPAATCAPNEETYNEFAEMHKLQWLLTNPSTLAAMTIGTRLGTIRVPEHKRDVSGKTVQKEGDCKPPPSSDCTDDTKNFINGMTVPGEAAPCPPLYRTLIAKPRDLQGVTINDPNSYTSVKSDIAIMQERKNDELVAQLNCNNNRIREPCIFNQSIGFREDLMEPILSSARRTSSINGSVQSNNTVVLSFKLPRGSHALSLLRERFIIKHGRYQDLLQMQ